MSQPGPTLEPFSLSASTCQVFESHFIDPHGRVIALRGANVSASSKVPNDPKPHLHDHAKVSYVNRPFSLEDAPSHWKRLKAWGMTFVRITVTWDAIEHAGPGEYDEAYLQYLRALLASMKEYGIGCYVAMHQDVWSRYCGGSGAPGWTLTRAGFDLSDDGDKLIKSGAAFLDGIRGGRLEGERGLWPTGYQKLAAASMNTFFWGGATFAPKLKVKTAKGEQNIQAFLQDHFFGAVGKLMDAVGDLDSVLGIELLNEPHPGYIGLSSINNWNYNTDLHLGDFPSPLEGFSLGSGHPTKVPHYTRSFPFPTKVSKHVTANTTSTSAWITPCPWEAAGVWRWSEQKSRPVGLQEDYFTKNASGRKVDFYQDFYWPFVKRWEAVVGAKAKSKKSELMRMVEAVPNEFCPDWPQDARPENLVYAPHWYDLNALFKKQMGFMTVDVQGLSRGMFIWNALYFGSSVKANYALQIKNIVTAARKKLGAVPVVFGECGVPMDLNNEEALKTGDWKWQAKMMDAMISAFESSMVGYNLWNYNPANTNSNGDDWNAENFSWYSEENRLQAVKDGKAKADDVDAGGRLLDVVVRPYAVATAGTPTSMEYNSETALFTYRFRSPAKIHMPGTPEPEPEQAEITELYLPRRMYESEDKISFLITAGGRVQLDLENNRAFLWFVDSPSDNTRPQRPRRIDIWVKERVANKKDIPGWVGVLGALLIPIFLYIAWWAQNVQWQTEKEAGIKIAKGWF